MLERQIFLGRYFLYNMLRSRIGRHLVRMGRDEVRARWEAIRQAEGGARPWLVVGNGPSLAVADLEELSALPSIASNKINLLYDSTDWRPTMYTVADPLLLFKLPREHYDIFPETIVPHTHYFMCRAGKKLPFHYLHASKYELWRASLSGRPSCVSSGIIDGSTVTICNIQIALWLGATTIYLIGCDHFYDKDREGRIAHAGAANHFHPDYRKPGEIVNGAPIERMETGYRRMRELAEANGARIVNISRQTGLTIFERGTVESALAAADAAT